MPATHNFSIWDVGVVKGMVARVKRKQAVEIAKSHFALRTKQKKHSLASRRIASRALQELLSMMDDTSPTSDGHEEKDRQYVTALARGLDVLGCFRSDDRYLSNHEISLRTGLARPTVSRLTYTLMKTDHLRRDEASGGYRLGPKVLQLGFGMIAATNITERCADGMEALSSGPNPYVTIALAERSGTRAVYLSVRRSRQAVSLSINIGARLPLFYSGIGRAILAGTPEPERQEILRMGIAEFPDHKERMEQSMRELLSDYETHGYCTSFGAWKPEINAIAAPVRSMDGTSIYGINIGGPSFLVSPDELHDRYGQRLRETVEDIAPTPSGSRAA